MRLIAPLLLTLAGLVSLAPVCRADLRHYHSRLVDGGANEGPINTFPPTASPKLSLDGAGNIFVEVFMDSASTLGAAHGRGPVIAKFDAMGELQWARLIPFQYTTRLAAALDGGVVLAGGFSGTVDFGAGPLTSVSQDIFLVKLDARGAVQWQKKFGLNQNQVATAVVVDGDGNIIITGSNTLTVDFGGGIIRSNGADDAFLAKFDGGGNHLWSRGFGSAGRQLGLGLALGTDNRIALAIDFAGAGIDFGGGSIPNIGGSDIAAAVFRADGSHMLSLHAGSPFGETGTDISLDTHNNVLLAGRLEAQVDLGGGIVMPYANSDFCGFVASYTEDGVHLWNYVLEDSLSSSTQSIATDTFGNCFVVGRSNGGLRFGLDRIPARSTYLLGFDSFGAPLAGMSIGGEGVVSSCFLRIDRSHDRIVLAAAVNGVIDFGGGELHSNRSDLALAWLGVRRAPDVTITQLEARAMSDGIELTWNMTGAEALTDYSITRQIDGSGTADVLQTAPAQTGNGLFIDRVPRPGRLHTYRLVVTTALGDEVASMPVSLVVPAVTNALEQNTPNPFNPLTTFAYSLAAPARVSIVIYDTRGAIVARLEQGEKPAGRHKASWGGHNMRGEFVASGVYFYRLDGVPGVGARKMVLLK